MTAFADLNDQILTMLGRGQDPTVELTVETDLVSEALIESNRGRRPLAQRQRWLDDRIANARDYFARNGTVRTYRQTAEAYLGSAHTLDRASRSFAVDYKLLSYIGQLCLDFAVDSPVVATRTPVDYCNCEHTTINKALIRLQPTIIRCEKVQYGRRIHLAQRPRISTLPGDGSTSGSYVVFRKPSALYERPALGHRGEWLMGALASGPKTQREIVRLTRFTPKVVAGLVDRAVSIGVATTMVDGRCRLITGVDLDAVIEETGALKLQQARQDKIADDRAYNEQREANIAEALAGHGLSARLERSKAGGLVAVVLPTFTRKDWRVSRLGVSNPGDMRQPTDDLPTCID